VWRGGAFFATLDFSKLLIAWILTFLLVTDFTKLRRIIFIQTASVVVICIISVLKGRAGGHPRLEGVLSGIYANPNDLAFAIVLSLPFCLAFMLSGRGALRKAVWSVSMLVMLAAVFMTASRGGFVTLVVAGLVTLWHFSVRGRRPYLIAVAVVVGAILLGTAGGLLRNRFEAIGEGEQGGSAYGSYEQRRELMVSAVEGIVRYPILGLGVGNFVSYSGQWREVHMTFLQVAVEVGLPAFVFYLMFFGRALGNLRKLRRMRDLDPKIDLFASALHASLIGFLTGACFAPEAYQYFPYFSVAYTSVLMAIVSQNPSGALRASSPQLNRFEAKKIFAHLGKANEPISVR
jgi:O-antigen ligase